MTDIDRTGRWFEPINDLPLRDMVLDGIRSMPSREAGTMISYEMISDWIDDTFPRRMGEFGERSYEPMRAVNHYAVKHMGMFLINVPNVGYRVATAAEAVDWAERHGYTAAIKRMQFATMVLGTVDRVRLDPVRSEMAAFLEREMRDEQGVMSRRLRAQHRRARMRS